MVWPKKQVLLMSGISLINISHHESQAWTSKKIKTVLLLILELSSFYAILLALKVFLHYTVHFMELGEGGGGVGSQTRSVFINSFNLLFHYVFFIVSIFSPRINKVIIIIIIIGIREMVNPKLLHIPSQNHKVYSI